MKGVKWVEPGFNPLLWCPCERGVPVMANIPKLFVLPMPALACVCYINLIFFSCVILAACVSFSCLALSCVCLGMYPPYGGPGMMGGGGRGGRTHPRGGG